jgi:putative tricarboxylic transport membrane protein
MYMLSLDLWAQGFATVLTPQNLLALFAGTLYGLFIGALPGVGPSFGVASMLPLTYNLPTDTAIIFLAAIHASTAYGDSIASILINTPGGAGSVAACWDGYPMARNGKAGMALGISAGGSIIGGVVGWLSLVLTSPILIYVALAIGPAEYAMIALFALSLLAVAAEGQLVKGLILCGVGLSLSFIGPDPVYGFYRYTFKNMYLEGGIDIIPVLLGLFALSQAIKLGTQGDTGELDTFKSTDSVLDGVKEAFKYPATLIRSGIIGIFLGIMPALGISTANIVAYMYEKRAAGPKERETFGRGNIRGLLAPETAKAACVVGDLVPTFTLGIPGSATTALFLAALMLHGIQPGPAFFQKGVLSYTVFAGILMAQICFFIGGIFLARIFAKTINIPNSYLAPGIVALCVLGAYAPSNEIIDVLVMAFFGVVGYLWARRGYPVSCVVLGLVLGNMLEGNYRRAMIIGDNNPLIFLTEPIAGAFLILTVLSLIWPYLTPLYRKFRPAGPKVEKEEPSLAAVVLGADAEDDDDDEQETKDNMVL